MSTSKPSTFFFFVVILSSAHGFNITEILQPLPHFSIFNSLLGGTGLTEVINDMISVTVLVVADDQLRSFNYLAEDEVRKILSFLVVYGYYDQTRLKALTARTILPTVYQGSTLTANYDGNGAVSFRAADSGPEMDVKLLDTVEDKPHSISVLQIASTIRLGSVCCSESFLS
ncbi:fasciclin-like arabinogalactan protein 14 [Hibiscus syriacus]|uniref:fasciclin-like arabinogalactan protein 14 n=1 Tax=Hibiscus syriacus TaxID=106335 RepID=UPI00192493E3|nr:fasciclin-like arabinogalactan protein 14 [Hibiscus syriacus]